MNLQCFDLDSSQTSEQGGITSGRIKDATLVAATIGVIEG